MIFNDYDDNYETPINGKGALMSRIRNRIAPEEEEITARVIAQTMERLTRVQIRQYFVELLRDGIPQELIREGIILYNREREIPLNIGNEEDNNQNGDGLLTRDPGVLPPSVQKLLNKVGSETINKITVWRKPISVNQALKNLGLKLPYDNIFHLAVNLNGKYNLEKNEYIKFVTGSPDGEKLVIPVAKPMTFDELFLKTKNRMGAEKFTEYDGVNNNCQTFITNILKTLDSFTPEANKFINQDAEKIFKSLGGPFAKFLTGVAVKASQIVNKIQEGGERDIQEHNFYLPLVQISK